MTQILIAHHDPDLGEEIETLLAETFDAETRKLSFTLKRNGAFALTALDDAPTMVAVVDLDLPSDHRTGPVPLGGLHFAEAARASDPALRLIFIAPLTSAELSAKIEALGDATLVVQGANFDDDLKAHAVQALACAPAAATAASDLAVVAPPRPPAPDPARLPRIRYLIEIVLYEHGNCIYRARSINDPVPYTNQVAFHIQRAELARLKAATAALRGSANWANDYKEIGRQLFRLVLAENFEIIRDLGRLDERVKSRGAGSHIAICFVVDRNVYPIAFEALRDIDDKRRYWLERAPLWRQLDMPARQTALFRDDATRDGPIDCLIVEADAEGWIEPWNLRFSPLPSVRDEADWLVSHLQTQTGVRVGRIGRIRQDCGRVRSSILRDGVLAEKEHDAPFAEVLESVLTAGDPWHLVHYAGHSHYDSARERGWLLLPGLPESPGAAPPLEQVGTSTFAAWLQRTRLVYMSSCYGSSQAFVYNLCEYQVAAVTGFRWTIGDETAGLHSRRFYVELFRRRSIEDALQGTWNHMYDSHFDDRVWISSELVMQHAA